MPPVFRIADLAPVALLLLAACAGGEPPAPVAGAPDDPAPATDGGPAAVTSPPDPSRTATFGGGCFWCVEAVLEQLDGVLDVRSGYMGGRSARPTYEQVCSGVTGHAEVVQVTFDPARIAYDTLLDWFWKAHDPTTLNRQGNDVGTQYRSVVFFHSDEQRRAAEASRSKAQAAFSRPIVTEIVAASTFWEAEEYHQDYYRGNKRQPYCQFVITPKLDKLGLEK
jgi:peptide-methionine (S)-S-oxide reductase